MKGASINSTDLGTFFSGEGALSHIAAMTALLLDTLRLSRALQGKGKFTSEQAEALAEVLGEASQGDLATKTDLAGVRTEIAGLKTELKTELAGVGTEVAELRTEPEIAGARPSRIAPQQKSHSRNWPFDRLRTTPT
jgi:hypothetical protein